jgi:hypothetical protein
MLEWDVVKEPVIFAAFGGVAINLLQLMELRSIPRVERPDLRDPVYWLPFLIWPLLGAGLAFAYVSSGTDLKAILALNVGASAPLALKAMAAAIPKGPPDVPPGA